MVSLDGVMQAPGGPEKRKDPSEDFKYGGWTAPYADESFGPISKKEIERAVRPAVRQEDL